MPKYFLKYCPKCEFYCRAGIQHTTRTCPNCDYTGTINMEEPPELQHALKRLSIGNTKPPGKKIPKKEPTIRRK